MALDETVGRWVGWAYAPWFGVGSLLRRARVLHPSGAVYAGEVLPLPGRGEALGALLRGPVLARFSGATWKHPAGALEVLGVALRFGAAPAAEPAAADQDLLFATIRRPWTLPLAPFTTHARNFLHDDYFAVSPFDVPQLGRVYFRLRPRRFSGNGSAAGGGDRYERLAGSLADDQARLVLAVRPSWRLRWIDVGEIRITRASPVDGEALRFSAFRSGKGIVPRGFVHALRRGAYAISQAARPRRARISS